MNVVLPTVRKRLATDIDADGVLSQTVFSGGGSEDTAVNDTLISGTDGDDYLLNDK